MIASYLLEPGTGGHNLDRLAKVYLGHDTIKYQDVVGKKNKGFETVSPEAAKDYACEGRGRGLDPGSNPAAQTRGGRPSQALSGPGIALDPRALRHGNERGPGGPGPAGSNLQGTRRSDGRGRGQDLPHGRTQVQYQFPQTARPRPVRGARTAPGQENPEKNRVFHRCGGAHTNWPSPTNFRPKS